MRVSRTTILPLLVGLPLVLGACGGGSSAAAGVTPTATASIQIIGTPAPSGASSAATTSTSQLVAALTVSATSSAASSAASSASTLSTATTAATTGAAYTVTGTGNVGLRLRQTPNGSKITDVPAGGVVTALGEPTQQAGGYTWIHVKTAKGETGWVATQFLAGGPPGTPLPGGQQ